MKSISLRAALLAVTVTAGMATAATPAIGIASAFGSFTVNNAQVSGNSNVYEGSQISTGKAASQIYLQGGSSVMLATNTGATVYNDHLVLSQGAVRVDNLSKYNVQALGYRIVSDTPNAQAAVGLRNGAVEVASMSGVVKVYGANGAMLSRVGAGTASSFKPGGNGTGSGSGAGTGQSGASGGVMSDSHFLVYTAILAGLAGGALGTLAYVNQQDSSSR